MIIPHDEKTNEFFKLFKNVNKLINVINCKHTQNIVFEKCESITTYINVRYFRILECSKLHTQHKGTGYAENTIPTEFTIMSKRTGQS